MGAPEWIEPMAATLTQDRFTGPAWIFERKFDGIRLLAFKRGTDVRLFSRNRLPQNMPALSAAIARLPANTLILDGEVTWDASTRAGARSGQVGPAYHVFDIIWIDDRDVRGLPLEERRALLRELPLRAPMRRVEALDDPRPWERACAEGWEGVIAKRRDSRYEHRRSPHWVKMKCEATQEFIVGGFTDPQGGRQGLGALLVGHYPETPKGQLPTPKQHQDFVYAGKVGTGFDTKLLLELRARLDKLEIPKPPFTTSTGLPRIRAHWVRPEVAVRVAFIEWTVHGKLRHSRLLGVTK